MLCSVSYMVKHYLEHSYDNNSLLTWIKSERRFQLINLSTSFNICSLNAIGTQPYEQQMNVSNTLALSDYRVQVLISAKVKEPL